VFQTVISINAKGNIKNLKQEVDSKVPTNDLLFWGQADNSENTLTILKDKSSHANDGVLNNFDNTSSSGFYNEELIFDGINDYVDIGYANYDFHNTQSYIIYIKLNELSTNGNNCFFGNWDGAGSGLEYFNQKIIFTVCNDKEYIISYDIGNPIINEYMTLCGTYDGTNVKLYINGRLIANEISNNLKISGTYISIGSNPPGVYENTNMSIKEAMLYDRALTEEEVKIITDGFNRKYKKNTIN